MQPTHILQTISRPKKVTHLVNCDDSITPCTSAAHVCERQGGQREAQAAYLSNASEGVTASEKVEVPPSQTN